MFVALHFYVHLLVFRAAAASAGEAVRERFGPPPSVEDLDEPQPWHAGRPQRAIPDQCGTGPLPRRVRAVAAGEQALTEHGHRFARWLLTTSLSGGRRGSEQPQDRAETTTRRAEPWQPQENPSEGVLQRITPVDACALPGLGQLVVSPTRSARMHWLNARSWTLILCHGRDLGSVRTAYARAAHFPAHSEEVNRQVSDSVRRLVAADLITHGM